MQLSVTAFMARLFIGSWSKDFLDEISLRELFLLKGPQLDFRSEAKYSSDTQI